MIHTITTGYSPDQRSCDPSVSIIFYKVWLLKSTVKWGVYTEEFTK
jgi:hypothetical protein